MRVLVWLVLLSLSLPTAADPVCATDSLARKVCLKAPAQRIITLAPHLAENVFSAGAGDRLVGVTSYSDYPEAAKAIPRVGSFNAFSLEQISASDPDLILVWGSGNGGRALSQLEDLGFTVYVDELQSIEDIPTSIRAIGQLAGTLHKAEPAAAAFVDEVEALRANTDTAPVTVFYQIWNQPLQTVGGKHIISEVIATCGGRNLFSDNGQLAPQVSLESVLARNPDVIIGSTMDSSEPVWLQEWQRYPGLKAVQQGQIFAVNPDTLQRPTLRLADGIGEICKRLQQAHHR